MVDLGKVGLVGSIDSFCNIVTLSAEGAGKGHHCFVLAPEASNRGLTLVQMILQFLQRALVTLEAFFSTRLLGTLQVVAG